jgi:hypothetical protein
MNIPIEISQDIAALNNGEIDFAEFQRRAYLRQKERFLPQLLEYRAAGKWKDFINTALSAYEVMPEAFMFYDEIPDNLKYDFAISAYQHHGDSIPAVRKAVRGAAKYGKADLPAELQAKEVITVYRAGEEDITKCKYRISWTTDRSVAEFFLNTYIGRHAAYLYTAQIRPADVIAYTDDRQEKEILQYRKVFDIKDITQKSEVRA